MATNKSAHVTGGSSNSKPVPITMSNPLIAAAPPNKNSTAAASAMSIATGGLNTANPPTSTNVAMAPAPSAAVVAAAAAALSNQQLAQQQQLLKRMGMQIPPGTSAANLNAIQNTLNNMNVAAMQLQMNQHQQRLNAAKAFKPTNTSVNTAGNVAVVSASNVPVPTVNTAGAGALNLSGTWELDREASDSTNNYLEAMVIFHL